MDEEDWLAACFKKREIVFINGRADADQVTDASSADADLHADARAEGESGEREWLSRVLFRQIIKSGANIFDLAATFIMLARTLANAPKVNAERRESSLIQRACCAKDYLIVHRPAAERVRVQHQRNAWSFTLARLLENRLKLTVRSGNEKDCQPDT